MLLSESHLWSGLLWFLDFGKSSKSMFFSSKNENFGQIKIKTAPRLQSGPVTQAFWAFPQNCEMGEKLKMSLGLETSPWAVDHFKTGNVIY